MGAAGYKSVHVLKGEAKTKMGPYQRARNEIHSTIVYAYRDQGMPQFNCN